MNPRKKQPDTARSLIQELVKMKTNGEIGCALADGKHGCICFLGKCRACDDMRIKKRARRFLKQAKGRKGK